MRRLVSRRVLVADRRLMLDGRRRRYFARCTLSSIATLFRALTPPAPSAAAALTCFTGLSMLRRRLTVVALFLGHLRVRGLTVYSACGLRCSSALASIAMAGLPRMLSAFPTARLGPPLSTVLALAPARLVAFAPLLPGRRRVGTWARVLVCPFRTRSRVA